MEIGERQDNLTSKVKDAWYYAFNRSIKCVLEISRSDGLRQPRRQSQECERTQHSIWKECVCDPHVSHPWPFKYLDNKKAIDKISPTQTTPQHSHLRNGKSKRYSVNKSTSQKLHKYLHHCFSKYFFFMDLQTLSHWKDHT